MHHKNFSLIQSYAFSIDQMTAVIREHSMPRDGQYQNTLHVNTVFRWTFHKVFIENNSTYFRLRVSIALVFIILHHDKYENTSICKYFFKYIMTKSVARCKSSSISTQDVNSESSL